MQTEIYTNLLKTLREGKRAAMEVRFKGAAGDRQDIHKRLINEQELTGMAKESTKKGLPVFKPGDDMSVVWEPFFPEERLIVLGGGHIAVPLVGFAAAIGFSVTVVDDRPSFANGPRFPQAKSIVCDEFRKAIGDLSITGSDYVVVITRGHRHDKACLQQLLNGPEPFYTGMIGSRRRIAAIKDALIGAGYDKERLARLHSPIGLNIGGITPEEIALSIAAELVACKRLHKVDVSDEKQDARADIDFDVLSSLANDAEAKAIVTVVKTKGSVPRGAGAKMLVYSDGRILGSIGGGCSEADVITKTREVIDTGGYLLTTVDLTGDLAEDEGMVCGGIMEVLIEDF